MEIEATGFRATGLVSPGALSRKAESAAGQFESLLIAQMLKSVRESESGWLGTGEDSASDSALAMAEEHFASAISAAGGLGLASVVKVGLETPHLKGSVGVTASKVGTQR